MKNLFITIVISYLLLSCNDKNATFNTEITVNVKDLKKGTLILKKIKDTSFINLDTIQVDGDAVFKIDLNLAEPEMLYLTLNRGTTNSMDNTLPFFASAGKITIETELESFFYNAKITGSKNHDLYMEYQKIGRKFNEQQLSLTSLKFLSMKTKNQLKYDSIQAVQDNILRRKYLYAVNFIINNKDYEVAPYVALTEIPNVSMKYMDTIQKAMPLKIANSLYGKKLQSLIAQRKLIER